jgi:hypothetical protein
VPRSFAEDSTRPHDERILPEGVEAGQTAARGPFYLANVEREQHLRIVFNDDPNAPKTWMFTRPTEQELIDEHAQEPDWRRTPEAFLEDQFVHVEYVRPDLPDSGVNLGPVMAILDATATAAARWFNQWYATALQSAAQGLGRLTAGALSGGLFAGIGSQVTTTPGPTGDVTEWYDPATGQFHFAVRPDVGESPIGPARSLKELLDSLPPSVVTDPYGILGPYYSVLGPYDDLDALGKYAERSYSVCSEYLREETRGIDAYLPEEMRPRPLPADFFWVPIPFVDKTTGIVYLGDGKAAKGEVEGYLYNGHFVPEWFGRVVDSYQQHGIWHELDTAVAEGRVHPSAHLATGCARTFLPPSTPNTVLVNERGQKYIILGGGPTSWDLAWQGISLIGFFGFPGASGGGVGGGQNVEVPYPTLPRYSQEVVGTRDGAAVLSGRLKWAGWSTLALPMTQSEAVTIGVATIHGWVRPYLMTGRGGGPGGPVHVPEGSWVPESTAGWSARARAYQQQITGRPAGEAYRVSKGGTRFDFDGHDATGLLEAKGPGYAENVNRGWFDNEWLSAARRQVAVADGAPITWHCAEEKVANYIRDLFAQYENLARIKVVFTPPVP